MTTMTAVTTVTNIAQRTERTGLTNRPKSTAPTGFASQAVVPPWRWPQPRPQRDDGGDARPQHRDQHHGRAG